MLGSIEGALGAPFGKLSGGAASECRRAKSHFALPFNRLRGPPGQRSAKPYCAGSSEAKCKFLAFIG